DYIAYRRSLLSSYPLALRIAVDCAENIPGREPAGAAAAEQKECAKWPVRRAFDIEAPANAVRRAIATFANAQLVLFPNRARATDVDWSECLGPMVTDYLQSSGRARPDSRCVVRLMRPPFVIAPPQ